MKYLLFSLGTRGDIEPFLAIAEQLKSAGHEVACAFPEQFRELSENLGHRFWGLSELFLELIEGERAQMVLGGKGNLFQKISTLGWMMTSSQGMQREIYSQQQEIIQIEQPDQVIFNQKCLYPVVWGMVNPGRATLLSPMPCTLHETAVHASLGMGSDHGAFLNKLSYRFSNFFLFLSIKNASKKVQAELGLDKLSTKTIKNHILSAQTTVYTCSASLFPRPEDWPENVHLVGHHERSPETNWQPSEALLAFIAKHPKLLLVSFGSMTNSEPRQTTADILEVLAEHQIPAIISTGSGGLVRPTDVPENAFFVESIPYDWIMPQLYAVVHHGGSGTTHLALKNGCASLIIPHILDQHLWNDLISELRAGPKGVPIKRLTAQRFENKVLPLWQHAPYKQRAESLALAMASETGKQDLLRLLSA